MRTYTPPAGAGLDRCTTTVNTARGLRNEGAAQKPSVPCAAAWRRGGKRDVGYASRPSCSPGFLCMTTTEAFARTRQGQAPGGRVAGGDGARPGRGWDCRFAWKGAEWWVFMSCPMRCVEQGVTTAVCRGCGLVQAKRRVVGQVCCRLCLVIDATAVLKSTENENSCAIPENTAS